MKPGAISRRQFVAGAAGASGLGLLAGCGRLPWQVAEPSKVPRIAYMATSDRSSLNPDDGAFLQGLRDLGYVEGQNILVDWWSAAGQPEVQLELMAELVRRPLDVIVVPSTRQALSAKNLTSTIPIVFIRSGDPVGLGLVDSLARPGGNVTGLSNLNTGLAAKRLELLKAAAPQATRIVCLYDVADLSSVGSLRGLTDAAQQLSVVLEPRGLKTVDDLDGALEAARWLPADALITAPGGLLVRQAARLADFALTNRLPAMYHLRQFVVDGGLMCYSSVSTVQFHRAASYVDRILKGTKPADLPIEQPMTFEFVVNMMTARELGLIFPHEILLQVTEVIE